MIKKIIFCLSCLVLLLLALQAFGKIETLDEALAKISSNNDVEHKEAMQFLKAAGPKGLDALLPAVSKENDLHKRALMVEGFGGFTQKKALEAVSEALATDNEEMQLAAVRAATAQKSKELVSQLIATIGSVYISASKEAISALIKYGDIAKKEIEDATTFPNSRIRGGALEVAGALRLSGIEKKLAIAISDADPGVSAGAIRGIGYLKSKEMFPKIVELSQSQEPEVALAAAQTLVEYGTPEAETALKTLLLSNAYDNARIIALDYFARNGLQSIDMILEVTPTAGMQLKKEIFKIAKKMNDPAVIARLVGELNNSDSYVALASAELLYEMEPNGREAIFTQLRDTSNQQVRDNLRSFFVGLGEPGVARLNAELKQAETDYRIAILDILGTVAHPSSVPFILELAKSPNPKLRLAIINTISAYQNPKFLKDIASFASDKNIDVRRAFFKAATDLTSNDTVDIIVLGLKDADLDTRLECISALGRSDSPKAVAHLAPLVKVTEGYERIQIIRALGMLKKYTEATKALLELVGNSNDEVSREAQKALK